MHRKSDIFLNFIESEIFLSGMVSENSFVMIFRESGGRMEVFISLFFAFSVLSSARLAEMTVFSRIYAKKISFYNFRNTMFRKSENLGLVFQLKIFRG